MQVDADILVDIHFYPKDKGGKKLPITRDWYGCPFGYEGKYYDCRIITKDRIPIKPGDFVKNLPLIFFSPELILPIIKEGTFFTLWEGGTKAEGKTLKILRKNL